MLRFRKNLGLAALFLIAASAWANDPIPECRDGKNLLEVNNESVLVFKERQPNQAKTRGNIVGTITRVFPDRNSHTHFEINLGHQAKQVVEVIYNIEFGKIDIALKPGMRVQACGDFINSSAPAGRYPASPSGAIIHWLHLNPKQGHEHGFLWIDGNLFGYDAEQAKKAGMKHDKDRRKHGLGRFGGSSSLNVWEEPNPFEALYGVPQRAVRTGGRY